jgi:hypothetical protein
MMSHGINLGHKRRQHGSFAKGYSLLQGVKERKLVRQNCHDPKMISHGLGIAAE